MIRNSAAGNGSPASPPRSGRSGWGFSRRPIEMSESEVREKPRRRLFTVLAAVVAVALVSCRVGTPRDRRTGDRDPRPRGTLEDLLALRERSDLNVLFVLVDTLRADRLGVYGYERDTSPNLDALAATGIRFAQQVSQSSWTKCSMASLWTGLYPVRNAGAAGLRRGLSGGPHARGDLSGGGLPHCGYLEERLDRSELRLLPGLRDLRQPALRAQPQRSRRASRKPQPSLSTGTTPTFSTPLSSSCAPTVTSAGFSTST